MFNLSISIFNRPQQQFQQIDPKYRTFHPKHFPLISFKPLSVDPMCIIQQFTPRTDDLYYLFPLVDLSFRADRFLILNDMSYNTSCRGVGAV